VRDDELRRLLTETNPWWKTPPGADPTAWTRHHRWLRDRDGHDLGYRTPVLADLAQITLRDALVVLTGPRRIGKSVALLDFAAALGAREDVDNRQIIHVPCDDMKPRDLRRALTLAYALTSSIDSPQPRRRIWLIDEVRAIPDWTATIKNARDQTRFGDDTVVLTSSRPVRCSGCSQQLARRPSGTSGLRECATCCR
jgi:predicted AAA+ superfamily ATPase